MATGIAIAGLIAGAALGLAWPLHAAQAAGAMQLAREQYPAKYEGPTTPSKAPAGLKVTVITCLSILHGCVSPADGVVDAGKKLGWRVTILDGGGNPNRQNAQILNAISSGAKVIVLVAIDPNAVQLGLAAAKKAGVLVVSGSNGIDSPNPVQRPANGGLWVKFDIGPDYAALGDKAADWIIADSKGKANIAIFSDKEFPSVIAFQNGLLEGLKKCGGCELSKLQYFTGNQVGTTLGQETVGYLRAHPGTDYLFSPYDPAAAAQVTAIEQAGLGNKVKLISVLGDQQNLNFIREGEVQAADAAYDNEYMGFAIADQIIRTLNKQPLFSP
ncbi:MAG: sugar ABC transporter substrate-binding protein, partial [Gemmataceae bacterium]